MSESGGTESSMYSSNTRFSWSDKFRTVRMQSHVMSWPPQKGHRSLVQKRSCSSPLPTPQSGHLSTEGLIRQTLSLPFAANKPNVCDGQTAPIVPDSDKVAL